MLLLTVKRMPIKLLKYQFSLKTHTRNEHKSQFTSITLVSVLLLKCVLRSCDIRYIQERACIIRYTGRHKRTGTQRKHS